MVGCGGNSPGLPFLLAGCLDEHWTRVASYWHLTGLQRCKHELPPGFAVEELIFARVL